MEGAGNEGPFVVLPAGNDVVHAPTNIDGQVAGWAMDAVAVHFDRHQDVTIGHEMASVSQLDSMRPAPPGLCAVR
jgi:hypothetical protein